MKKYRIVKVERTNGLKEVKTVFDLQVKKLFVWRSLTVNLHKFHQEISVNRVILDEWQFDFASEENARKCLKAAKSLRTFDYKNVSIKEVFGNCKDDLIFIIKNSKEVNFDKYGEKIGSTFIYGNDLKRIKELVDEKLSETIISEKETLIEI